MIQVLFSVLLLCGLSEARIWRGLDPDSIPLWSDSVSAYSLSEDQGSPVDSSEIEASGYKSIRIVTGDQGTEIHQEMRLGIQGEAAPGWFVEARLVDEGLQAGEMRVTTLQQVDEMFLRIQHGAGALTVGNLRYQQDSLALFGTDHQTLGAMAQYRGGTAGGQWAFGQDPVQRKVSVFPGRDGQRKGYLIDTEGGRFVAVVPGSERVYWNGTRLQSGKDYTLEPMGGVLDFLAILPSSRDQIRVEYELYGDSYSQGFLGTDAYWRFGRLRLEWAGVGEWADLDEVRRRMRDTVDQDSLAVPLESPQDLRLVGLRLRLDMGWYGFTSVEGAYSRFDSNSLQRGIPVYTGSALRWRLASTEEWVSLRKGLQWDYLGNFRTDLFTTQNHRGSANDWDSYELRENWELDSLDSTSGRRMHQQLRVGMSPDGTWRPWLGGGLRGGGESFESRRVESGLDHSTRVWISQMRLALIEAQQEGQKRKVQGEMQVENREGLIRPYGSGYSGWRKLALDSTPRFEVLDLRSASGIRYGRESLGWNGSLEVSGEELRRRDVDSPWKDSLNHIQSTHRFQAENERGGVQSLLQWKRVWDGALGAGDFWISEQQGHWNYLEQDGKVLHRLGLTREHPLVPDYQRVAAGTGDVAYDSLLQEYVEGVDRGDYIRDGWVREDSLPVVEQGDVALQLEEWIATGPLFRIRHGILRDLRIGFRGDWSRKDTGQIHYLPPFRWSDMQGALEGVSLQEGLLRWNEIEQRASLELRSGRMLERRWSVSQVEERSWWQGTTGILRFPESWEWESSLDREEFQVESPSRMEWRTMEVHPQVRKDFFADWTAELTLRVRWSEGASEWGPLDGRLWQPGAGIRRSFPGGGEVRADYSYTLVRKEDSSMPWRILDGFAEGWTHRVESRASYQFRERLSLEFTYVWRLEQDSPRAFHKVSGEARAFF